ncbi:MAG TPA: TlpA disulfide reductase family protein [Burkholderiales bacterium]|nr:TlpA disulfide reductase family protein [Burkholderiales bacterium]
MKAKLIVGIGALAAAVAWAAAIVVISAQTLFKPAPEVRFTPLSGETFSTSDLRGKVVLVNFWGSYCTPCIKEMPKIVATHEKFAVRGYETVAVAVRRDNPSRVVQFAASRALPFKVALDSSGELAKEFGNVRITPTSFLIDRQGRVLRRYVGEHDWAELHHVVERELAR